MEITNKWGLVELRWAGFEPASLAYETSKEPLLYPAIIKLDIYNLLFYQIDGLKGIEHILKLK